MEEKALMKLKEESFFQDTSFDYDEYTDGQNVLNRLLSYSYGLEIATVLYLAVFMAILPGAKWIISILKMKSKHFN